MALNFRDMSGYRTQDGHQVQRGLVWRYDQINLLSEADLAMIAALHPAVIEDLLT